MSKESVAADLTAEDRKKQARWVQRASDYIDGKPRLLIPWEEIGNPICRLSETLGIKKLKNRQLGKLAESYDRHDFNRLIQAHCLLNIDLIELFPPEESLATGMASEETWGFRYETALCLEQLQHRMIERVGGALFLGYEEVLDVVQYSLEEGREAILSKNNQSIDYALETAGIFL